MALFGFDTYRNFTSHVILALIILYQTLSEFRYYATTFKIIASLMNFIKVIVKNSLFNNCVIKIFASSIIRIVQMYENKRRLRTSRVIVYNKWRHFGETSRNQNKLSETQYDTIHLYYFKFRDELKNICWKKNFMIYISVTLL